MALLLVLAALLGTAMAAGSMYDMEPAMYDDLLMQDLYKKLAMLQNPLPEYYYEDDAVQMPKEDYLDSHEISLKSRAPGSADIRDQEYIEHSSHGDGFQYISGGAGEGKQALTPEGSQQNQQEVKTDEHLPFYCHPPNPCPKGFTEDDGCNQFVEDTAEFQRQWIWRMQQKGMCACDEEHMFHCPKDENTINAEKGNLEKNKLDEVLDNLLADTDESNNPYAVGSKREKLVAKKSPRVKRNVDEDIDAVLENMKMTAKRDHNPYLGGYKLSRAAKKGVGFN